MRDFGVVGTWKTPNFQEEKRRSKKKRKTGRASHYLSKGELTVKYERPVSVVFFSLRWRPTRGIPQCTYLTCETTGTEIRATIGRAGSWRMFANRFSVGLQWKIARESYRDLNGLLLISLNRTSTTSKTIDCS